MKSLLKKAVFRFFRPAVHHLDERLARIESHLGLTDRSSEKYQGELAFWRQWVKGGLCENNTGAPSEVTFGRWQRERLVQLGEFLGLGAEPAIDIWCRERSVVEIGAGPYPAIAAARLGWKRAVAVDPLGRAYEEEGLVPPSAERVVYIEGPGENVPLPSRFADLVIIENCLDHVSDPAAVINEIFRLLKPGGYVWLFVDLSEYADHMHPHPMSEPRIKSLMGEFELVRGQPAPNKAHPEAYGAYRGLFRKPEMAKAASPGSATPSVTVRASADGVHSANRG